jgi:hypothetical protein
VLHGTVTEVDPQAVHPLGIADHDSGVSHPEPHGLRIRGRNQDGRYEETREYGTHRSTDEFRPVDESRPAFVTGRL